MKSLKTLEFEEKLMRGYQQEQAKRTSNDKSEFEIFAQIKKPTTRRGFKFKLSKVELYQAVANQKANSPNQVVFKILKGAPRGYAVKKLMEYIAKDGGKEITTTLEDEFGNTLEDKEAIAKKYNAWKDDFSKTKNGKDALHLILSTTGDPTKINQEIIKESARDILQRRFNKIGIDYVFAYHQNGNHPHIHIILRKRNQITGKQFNFKKNDPLIFGIRKDFSDELTKRGIKREAIVRKSKLQINLSNDQLRDQSRQISTQADQLKQYISKSDFEAQITKNERIDNSSGLSYLKRKKFVLTKLDQTINKLKANGNRELKEQLKELQATRKDILANYLLTDQGNKLEEKSLAMIDQLSIDYQAPVLKKKTLSNDYLNQLASELTAEKVFILKYHPRGNSRNKIIDLIDDKLDQIEAITKDKAIYSDNEGLKKLKDQALKELEGNIAKSTREQSSLLKFKEQLIQAPIDHRTNYSTKLIRAIEQRTKEIISKGRARDKELIR